MNGKCNDPGDDLGNESSEKIEDVIKKHERKKTQHNGDNGFFFLFFRKFDQMSRVGSRDRHAGWRSKMSPAILQERCEHQGGSEGMALLNHATDDD